MPGGAVTRLEAIWHFCGNHEPLLWRSPRCGCFHCESFFAPTEIEDWVDRMSTALCPRCGVDAVLPDVPLYALDTELLREMHEFYFLSPARKSAAQPAEPGGEEQTDVVMSVFDLCAKFDLSPIAPDPLHL